MKKVVVLLMLVGMFFVFSGCDSRAEIDEPADVIIGSDSYYYEDQDEYPGNDEAPQDEISEEPYEEDSPADEDTDTTPQPAAPPSAVNIQIAVTNDEFLRGFAYVHEVDYRAGYGLEHSEGLTLVIWADAPLRDIALIMIENDFVNDELVFIPVTTFGMIDILLPGQAFVINSYIGGGTLPQSGITFVDENGNTRYFTMQDDRSAFLEPDLYDPDILDMFVDGELTVEIITQTSGGARRYFTVTQDESGQFDPDRWFDENMHLWFIFALREFSTM